LDIGGNTGYFTFQALAAGASHVRYIEGNQTHAEFVQVASSVVDPGGSIQVTNRYYDFAAEEDEVVDVAFLLNVVHHLGDDFGSKSVACHEAKELMITSVNRMARKCRRLVFQMGFCWKGNRNLLLFPNGTKQEMIDFVRAGTNGIWDVRVIGVAERDVNGISYGIPSQENLRRQDQMGEFLNRPLFVMERC
jgi:hypothetical protein